MCRPQAAHLAADLEAVEAGHRDVEHDQVGVLDATATNACGAVGGLADDISLRADRARQHPAHRRVVVNDKNPLAHTANYGLRTG